MKEIIENLKIGSWYFTPVYKAYVYICSKHILTVKGHYIPVYTNGKYTLCPYHTISNKEFLDSCVEIYPNELIKLLYLKDIELLRKEDCLLPEPELMLY